MNSKQNSVSKPRRKHFNSKFSANVKMQTLLAIYNKDANSGFVIFLEIMQCTQTKFLSPILISLVFRFDCKIKKNLISTVTHLTRYIEMVLMRMSPHTFSHMIQNSISILDF